MLFTLVVIGNLYCLVSVLLDSLDLRNYTRTSLNYSVINGEERNIVIAIGVFLIKSPYTVWHMYEGWRFEEEMEPSDTYIGVTVASGVFIIIASVGLILFA